MEKYFNINYEFSPQEVGRRIDEQLSKNEADYICVADGVILNNANRKPDYLKIVNGGMFAICDSGYVPLYIKWLYGKRYPQYCGSLIFKDLVSSQKYRMFFMGTNQRTLDGLRENLKVMNPKVENMSFYELPFKAVDELPTTGIKNNPLVDKMLLVRAIEAPVLFRMLYSTGIRVNEIRWLHRDDVDLENGIIYVRRSKGYYERIIALHPAMTELLCKYDRLIRKEVPDTEIFFPNADGSMHNSAWIRVNFKALWYKYNPKPADGSREVVPYVFRHNYAIENIMSWDQRGYNADKKMVALSKSMGHRGIQSTQYYFHLVPRFADLLDEKEGASVSEIIPDIL